MQIVGLGTDIIEISRIGRMCEDHGEHFLQRVFTAAEVQYCQSKKNHLQHFAARWAAKEAVMKTLGTGWAKGVTFSDIEVCPLRSGAPRLVLHGGAQAVARQLGITKVLITLSHCKEYATATAIAVNES